jgi:hypothetical protein
MQHELTNPDTSSLSGFPWQELYEAATLLDRVRCFLRRPLGHAWEPWGFSERCWSCGSRRKLDD